MSFVAPAYLEVGVVFDMLAMIVTFSVAMLGYKLYLLFRKPSYLHFSTGFFLMSISFLFFAIINFLTYAEQTGMVVSDGSLHIFLSVFLSLRNFVMLTALLILFFMYYEVSQKTLQLFIALLVLSVFIFTGAGSTVFFILSAFLLLFLSLKLYQKYRVKPDKTGLWVLLGFVMIFIAKLFNGLIFISGELYIVSYLFRLAGFGVILYSLWVVSR